MQEFFILFIGSCQAQNGEDCKFPFKWMGVTYESCLMLNEGGLDWCATDVNLDGSFDKFEFCDGKCYLVQNSLVTNIVGGSDCCNENEKCFTVKINYDLLGKDKINFFDNNLSHIMNVPPNGYLYKDIKGIEAIFR